MKNMIEVFGKKPEGMSVNEWITEKSSVQLSWDMMLGKQLSKRVIKSKRKSNGCITFYNW